MGAGSGGSGRGAGQEAGRLQEVDSRGLLRTQLLTELLQLLLVHLPLALQRAVFLLLVLPLQGLEHGLEGI